MYIGSSLARETTIVFTPRSPSPEISGISCLLRGCVPTAVRTPSPHRRLAAAARCGRPTAINHRLQRARGPRNLTPPPPPRLPSPSLSRPVATAARHKLNSRASARSRLLLLPLCYVCTGRALLRSSCVVEPTVPFEGFNGY